MSKQNKETIFISLTQLSEETGISKSVFRKEILNGNLPAVKIGCKYFIYKQDSDNFIFNLVCKARKVDPEKYMSLMKQETTDVVKEITGKEETNDKS